MIRVKFLCEADEPQWRELWKGYLDFYEESLAPEVTAQTWNRLLSGSPYEALVAVEAEKLVGFAHFLFHPSTWSTEDYCYLEDLYVSSDCRGKGGGRKLLDAVYERAKERQCRKVYWVTEKNNKTARKLYDKVADLSEFVQYRRAVKRDC